MNFPPFWAKGTVNNFTVWRWSATSIDEARTAALEAAGKLFDKFRSGGFDRNIRYNYGDRPLREEVLREFRDLDGNQSAVITRNSYGCLVLNTARMMFVDIDLPELKSTGILGRLFGGAKPPPTNEPEIAAIDRATQWAEQHPGWGWRIYRTRAGLRLLASHSLFNPEDAEQVFVAMDSDPLYRRLCKTQKCFRARLTPKPWRCGVSSRPDRWPFETPRLQKRFEVWNDRYLKACNPHATCQLISTVGSSLIHPDAAPLITIHDEVTRAESQLPLA